MELTGVIVRHFTSKKYRPSIDHKTRSDTKKISIHVKILISNKKGGEYTKIYGTVLFGLVPDFALFIFSDKGTSVTTISLNKGNTGISYSSWSSRHLRTVHSSMRG